MMGFLDNAGLAHVWAKVKAALSAKQDKLTGTAGQVVGFDAQGQAVAQDAPEGGITQDEADGRYLQLSGGVITGRIESKTNAGNDKKTIGMLEIGTISEKAGSVSTNTGAIAYIALRTNNYEPIYPDFEGMDGSFSTRNNLIIWGVADPKRAYDAANKKYVDDAIAAALNGSNEAKQEERIEISYSEGATSSSFTLTGNFANKRVIIALARYSNRDTVLAQYIVDYTISEPPVSYEYSGGFSFERYGNQIMYYGESLSQVNAILITEF